MQNELNSQLEQVREQLQQKHAIEQALLEHRETLGKETYRLETLEIQLGMIQSDLAKLEQFGLASVLSGVTGTRAGKIDRMRAESERVEREYGDCAQIIETLEQELSTMESQLASLATVEEAYQTLAKEKERLLAENGDENAQELNALTNDLACAEDNVRRIEKAIETGEALLAEYEATFSSSRRIRTGSTMLSGTGAILRAAQGAYREHHARKVTSQIHNPVKKFCDALAEVDLTDETGVDAELRSALPQLEVFSDRATAGLTGDATGWLELETVIRTALGDLEDKLAQASQTVTQIQQRRQALIDST